MCTECSLKGTKRNFILNAERGEVFKGKDHTQSYLQPHTNRTQLTVG